MKKYTPWTNTDLEDNMRRLFSWLPHYIPANKIPFPDFESLYYMFKEYGDVPFDYYNELLNSEDSDKFRLFLSFLYELAENNSTNKQAANFLQNMKIFQHCYWFMDKEDDDPFPYIKELYELTTKLSKASLLNPGEFFVEKFKEIRGMDLIEVHSLLKKMKPSELDMLEYLYDGYDKIIVDDKQTLIKYLNQLNARGIDGKKLLMQLNTAFGFDGTNLENILGQIPSPSKAPNFKKGRATVVSKAIKTVTKTKDNQK